MFASEGGDVGGLDDPADGQNLIAAGFVGTPLSASLLRTGAISRARLAVRMSGAAVPVATHWDEVVTEPGYEHLRRHDLRHTAA